MLSTSEKLAQALHCLYSEKLTQALHCLYSVQPTKDSRILLLS